jgi:hypothetical protein
MTDRPWIETPVFDALRSETLEGHPVDILDLLPRDVPAPAPPPAPASPPPPVDPWIDLYLPHDPTW